MQLMYRLYLNVSAFTSLLGYVRVQRRHGSHGCTHGIYTPWRPFNVSLLSFLHADGVQAGLDFEAAQKDPEMPEISSCRL